MKRKSMKKLLWVLTGLLGLAAALWCYFGVKGSPVQYVQAKRALTAYAQAHYGDRLTLGGMHYSSKMGGFVLDVTERNDTRNSSFLLYGNGGHISDDYAFRVRMHMEDEVAAMLTTLLATRSGLTAEQARVTCQIDMPDYVYSMADHYDPALAVSVDIELTGAFEDEAAFARAAYSAAQTVGAAQLKLGRVTLMSFLPTDGNSWYEASLTDIPRSEADMLHVVTVKRSEKASPSTQKEQ